MKRGDANNLEIKRGDVFFADLSPTVGSEQGGKRPVVVIQNNIGNRFSPTVIVASVTTKLSKAKLPTHIEVTKEMGFEEDSLILLEQIRTIDKKRLTKQLTHLNESVMKKVNTALAISAGLIEMGTPTKKSKIIA